jgi:hypothetical protein
MEQKACNDRVTSGEQRETPMGETSVKRGCNTLTKVRALPPSRSPGVTPRVTPTELVSVASTVEYELFELPDRSTTAWRCMRLVRHARDAGKKNWWFGWNGERIARSTDAKNLAEHHPAVHAWVIETLKGTAS